MCVCQVLLVERFRTGAQESELAHLLSNPKGEGNVGNEPEPTAAPKRLKQLTPSNQDVDNS